MTPGGGSRPDDQGGDLTTDAAIHAMCRNESATRLDHAQTSLLDASLDHKTVVTAPNASDITLSRVSTHATDRENLNQMTSRRQFAYLTGNLELEILSSTRSTV